MNRNEKLKELINVYKFNEGTAVAYLESKGRCVYCGTDLLETVCTYFSADIDHLLPKSKYPNVESNPRNWVLSCRACNSMKGKAEIYSMPWSSEDAVNYHKEELIHIIRERLSDKRELREKELNAVRSIIQD